MPASYRTYLHNANAQRKKHCALPPKAEAKGLWRTFGQALAAEYPGSNFALLALFASVKPARLESAIIIVDLLNNW
jgi:hypothetical protein